MILLIATVLQFYNFLKHVFLVLSHNIYHIRYKLPPKIDRSTHWAISPQDSICPPKVKKTSHSSLTSHTIQMAGSGQPWFMPLTWPLGHVSTAVTKPEEDKPPPPSSTPYLDLTGNFTAMAAAARFVLYTF